MSNITDYKADALEVDMGGLSNLIPNKPPKVTTPTAGLNFSKGIVCTGIILLPYLFSTYGLLSSSILMALLPLSVAYINNLMHYTTQDLAT
jgi:hypothetical protein